MLYPPTESSNRPQASRARRNSELAQATSHTVPNPYLGSALSGQHLRHNSTHQTVSPSNKVHRTSDFYRGPGSPSTSLSSQHNISPIRHQRRFLRKSGLSSMIGLDQLASQSRPPVPTFSQSTGSIPQANMAGPDNLEGSSFRGRSKSESLPLTCSLDDLVGFTTSHPIVDNSVQYMSFDSGYDFVTDPAFVDASSTNTVSPQDLLLDSTSTPPSGTMTNLTTPGTSSFESPGIVNSTDTSPLFSDNLEFDDSTNLWPLFQDEQLLSNPVAPQTIVPQNTSPTTKHVAPQMSRNSSSSPGKPSTRTSNQGRHSFTAGVAPKRREKPLPAIEVDPNDIAATKRARNTMAARKSREKRLERTDALMAQVQELEEQVEYWKGIAVGLGHRE